MSKPVKQKPVAQVRANANEALSRIEMMSLHELQKLGARRNPKKHDVEKVARSIAAYGFNAPPVLNETTGHLVAGHGRVKALTHLQADGKPPPARIEVRDGSWFVPVLRGVSFKSDAEAEQYLLADNRLVEIGGWELPELSEMLDEIRKTDADALEVIGWSDKEVERMLREVTKGEVVEDEVPEPPKVPVTKLGDLWTLGEHRILCGDSTKPEDVARVMGGELAQIVFTDPPYGVSYDGGTVVREKLAGDDTTALYEPAAAAAFKHSDAQAPLYLWHAGVKGLAAAAAAAAAAAGYVIRCEIVWNKNQAQFGALSAQYKQKHEPCYYCVKRKGAPRWFGPTNEVTVWDVDRASVNEFHPTQKPVGLAARALNNSSASGDIVADWFSGSGSTLIAAEQLGRRCRTIELAPGYVDVAVQRWETLTGGKATRA